MRTVHIDTGREMRGGQWQVLYLLEGLLRRGHSVMLLARPGAPLFETARERGIDVRPATLGSVLRTRGDLIHAHDARAHTLACLVGGRPLVVARRVAFPLKTGSLSRWKYTRATHYIAVSDCVRGVLVSSGIEPQRISVVYDGVPLPPELSTRLGKSVVAPATDDPRKGTALLRQAGLDVRFSTDLAVDLREAPAFVYISQEEGLGSAALLAMAAGVPVVASRVGGLTEIVVDGETGILTENDPPAISEAVKRLLRDPDLAMRFGAAGRRRVAERFSVDRMVDATLQVYDRILPC